MGSKPTTSSGAALAPPTPVLVLAPPSPVLVLATVLVADAVEPPAPVVLLPVVESSLHPAEKVAEAARAAATAIEIERLFMGKTPRARGRLASPRGRGRRCERGAPAYGRRLLQREKDGIYRENPVDFDPTPPPRRGPGRPFGRILRSARVTARFAPS